MSKNKFEIFPVVENEVLPDETLELIKGGAYTTVCGTFECGKKYEKGTCGEGFFVLLSVGNV